MPDMGAGWRVRVPVSKYISGLQFVRPDQAVLGRSRYFLGGNPLDLYPHGTIIFGGRSDGVAKILVNQGNEIGSVNITGAGIFAVPILHIAVFHVQNRAPDQGLCWTAVKLGSECVHKWFFVVVLIGDTGFGGRRG